MKFLKINLTFFFIFCFFYLGIISTLIYFFGKQILFWIIFLSVIFLTRAIFVIKIFLSKYFFEYQKFWIFAVVVLPFFGDFLYFLYGKNNYKHSKNKKYWQQNLKKMHNFEAKGFERGKNYLHDPDLTKQAKNVFTFLQKYSKHPLYKDVSMQLIFSTYQKMKLIEEDFKNAKKYIYISYYIFNDGFCLDWFTNLLISQSKRGIKIYLNFEFYGKKFFKKDFKKMQETGIKFASFGKNWRITHDFFYINHRKFIVIDGKIGYLGGFNIGDPHANVSPFYGYWIDAHLRFVGSAVRSLELIFLKDWLYLTKKWIGTNSIEKLENLPLKTKQKNSFFQILDQTPRIKKTLTKDLFFNLLSEAKEKIYISTAYFFIDKSIENILISKAQSGVKVNIFLPEFVSIRYVVDLQRLNYQRLIKNNVKIYEISNTYLHAKVCLIDDHIATIGSCNFDFHSFYFSSEITAVLNNFDINKKLKEKIFLKYNKNAKLIKENPLIKKNICYRFFLKFLRIAVMFF